MKAPKSTVPKINGFSRGLNIFQIGSYFLMISKLIVFSWVLLPNLVRAFQIISALIYYGSSCIVAVYCYIASTVDPTDEVVIEERKCRLARIPFDSSKYEYQCDYCTTSVTTDSKHCSVCDRCVKDFDHHCNWINNCVSKKNYKTFLIMIISLALSTFWFILADVVFIVDYYTQQLGIVPEAEFIKNDPSQQWKAIVAIVYVGIIGLFFLLDVKLLNFHIYLIRNNITTYEYIVKQREAREKPFKKKGLRLKTSKKQQQITPLETPKTPAEFDENKRVFNFVQSEETKSLSVIKRTALEHLGNKLEKERGDHYGMDDVHQNLTCDDFDNNKCKTPPKSRAVADNEHFVAINIKNQANMDHGDRLKNLGRVNKLPQLSHQGKLRGEGNGNSSFEIAQKRKTKQRPLEGDTREEDQTNLSGYPDPSPMTQKVSSIKQLLNNQVPSPKEDNWEEVKIKVQNINQHDDEEYKNESAKGSYSGI